MLIASKPWITPSLFESFNNTNIVDEYTLGQNIDHDTALGMLQSHWQTWITEDDFKAISAAGLNHVRYESMSAIVRPRHILTNEI